MSKEELISAKNDITHDIKTTSIRTRAEIYQDIPIEALGVEADKLIADAKKEILKHANKMNNPRMALTYSIDQKIEAAVVYGSCGTIKGTAREMNVSPDLIRRWTTQSWWNAALKITGYYKTQQLHAKFTNASEITIDKLVDRIEKGQVTTKDLISASKIFNVEKRELRKDLQVDSEKDATKDALLRIQKELKKVNRFENAKNITPDSSSRELTPKKALKK